MQKLIECVPNFSEGRRKTVIDKIANSAKRIKGARILDIEWDRSHNRSLITIVGAPDAVFKAVYGMIKTATKLIDMEKHQGEHPRIGAADVVPFVPISNVSLRECASLAKKLGAKVAKELKIPVYLYEAAATRPDRVNLADVRKGEYEGLKKEIETNPDRKPDFGPSRFHPTAGAMVIGARKYLIAYNVNLDTKDISIAKKIASRIREKGGGLVGVKALGFEVDGYGQVSMNLVDYEKTNIDAAYLAVEKEAKRLGVGIRNSEVVKAVKDLLKVEDLAAEQILEKKIYD
jgi:glutamate formiminotransferase